MVKRLGYPSASRSNAPAGRDAGQDPTRGGGRFRSHPTRPRTWMQIGAQTGVGNGDQPQVVASQQAQNQVDRDTPAAVPVAALTDTLPADVVVRMLNVLEALVPN
ncbi:hypothetical protein P3L10_008984 [Capsicum annuum]